MILTGFFKWWYLEGWRTEARRIFDRIRWINDRLSTKILLKTLIKPWKQTISDARPGVSLQERMENWAGNQVSRLVGLMMRGALVLFSVAASAVLFVYGALLAVLWPFIPILVLVLPVLAMVMR